MFASDKISIARIAKLHPEIRGEVLAIAEMLWAQGVPMRVTQGMRTIEEQNALYAIGRTTPGKIVTNAKGGTSYHNYGLAFDFCLLRKDGTVSWSEKDDINADGKKDWAQVVTAYTNAGYEWGGNWHTIKDTPHLQKTFGKTIADLRKHIGSPYPPVT